MNILLIPDIFGLITKYIEFNDLVSLMRTSLQFRDYIGLSDIWKYLDIRISDELKLKALDLFKIFLNLDFYKHNHKIRHYYSPWYYLYIMKKYLRTWKNIFNIYILINSNLDEAIYISNELFERVVYDNLNILKLNTRAWDDLNRIDHPDKDKILKMIYIGSKCEPIIYFNKFIINKFYIRNNDIERYIKYNPEAYIRIGTLVFNSFSNGIYVQERIENMCCLFNINCRIFTKIIIALFGRNKRITKRNFIKVIYEN